MAQGQQLDTSGGRYRLTLVNRLGEGRSILFETEEAAWSKWDEANAQRSLYRYASLIELHHGRVMALFADGGFQPQAAGKVALEAEGGR